MKYIVRIGQSRVTMTLRPVHEPRRERLTGAPKWVRRYKFITHRSVGELKGWTLTELSTGYAIIKCCTSRRYAVRLGLLRMLMAGCKKFRSAIAKHKMK